jgi:hypothetical protein
MQAIPRLSESSLTITLAISILLLSTVAFAQNPFEAIRQKAEEKAFEKTAGTLLNDQLPVKLDATSAFPTVDELPGSPFMPRPIAVTRSSLRKPLPPGDYTMPVMAYCTEYSVHRPGQGIAYELAPLQGKAAGAVANLLWRGTFAGVPPQHLQAVAWGIQSGLTYERLPKTFQATIDRLVPDYKSQLEGDFVQRLEDTYSKYAAAAKLPPLDTVLARMGKSGELTLEAKRQRQALLAANTSDEIKQQTLFAGQESGVYTPVKAQNGPWTERIPGVAYMRYRIQGGNLQNNNILEIRILPSTKGARQDSGASLVQASFNPETVLSANEADTSPLALLGTHQTDQVVDASGIIGYPIKEGAQDLVPVPVPEECGEDALLPPPSGATPLCGDPALPFNYNKSNKDIFHHYEDLTSICNVRQSKYCTVENVFRIMLQTPGAVAPVVDSVRPADIQNCAVVQLITDPANLIGYDNKIRMVIDPGHYSVTNYTLSDHVFYPGNIVRQIINWNGTIAIQTIGEGVGCYKAANIAGGILAIWPKADAALKQAVAKELGVPPPR